MKSHKTISLPPIGMRIIKSAVAVLVCYLVSFLRKDAGIVFYSQLAALWCIQTYRNDTKKNAFQRMLGTAIGAAYGLLFLLLERHIRLEEPMRHILNAVVISGMIVLVLYTTVLIKKKYASYFSCVVFLSIVVNHAADANPYLFVWNRFLDTLIGIFVGVGVNVFSLPVDKRKDILFISGVDDTLADANGRLSDYSRVELNRMLDDGVRFTLSTMRTPASLHRFAQDIRLNLPVIAMDGAVLYDINENTYLKAYVISKSQSLRILEMIREMGYTCFVNCVIDDVLVICYEEEMGGVQEEILREMRKSPYRNYLKMGEIDFRGVVYFMMLYPEEDIERIYRALEETGIVKELKVLKYASKEYSGYSYIKIYNKNAVRENMNRYLMEMTGASSMVTFGSIPGKYDVVVRPGDENAVVRELKKRYEPFRKLFNFTKFRG
ncbi:MAG: HAD hydrolase family protein [bacterium]|nr:HAD hydrolase family protein [bacterium]MCM1423638.1 HAD hydrolase family protein [bacterium]